MKVVIAIDSFKGSLNTNMAGEATREGVLQVYKDARVVVMPIADGGEGTVEAVISATDGEMIDVAVCGPIGNKVSASYGIIPKTKTAVIEMAAAAGITLIEEKQRNPLMTTTYGVGQMIMDAISRGCRKFVIGIGGSATNDGGVGMLQAMGFEFLDKDGRQVPYGARGLSEIAEIRTENAAAELKECTFSVACDVKNVLCGENGCSRIYGPQKGATDDMIKDMDTWLKRYAELTKQIIPDSDASAAGTGAAGGLGFALLSYLNARLESGIGLVIKETGLEEQVKDADIVITGEGRLDGQSYMGKVPVGVAELAKKYNKTVVAFSGCVSEDAEVCNDYGIDAFFPVVRKPCTLQEAMDSKNAYKNLKATVNQAFRLIEACRK